MSFFLPSGPEAQTHVVGLGNKHLYPLIHLARPVSILEFLCLGQLFRMKVVLVGEKDWVEGLPGWWFGCIWYLFVVCFWTLGLRLGALCKGQDSKYSRFLGQ